jgi:hypothetical protein
LQQCLTTLLVVVTAPEIVTFVVKLTALLPTEQWGVPSVDVHSFYVYTDHSVNNNSEDKGNAVDITIHVYTGN